MSNVLPSSREEVATAESTLADSNGCHRMMQSKSEVQDASQYYHYSPRGCTRDKSILTEAEVRSSAGNDQRNKKKMKKPSLLSFLTTREPSAQALAEYQDTMRKQQHNKGDLRPSAVGMAMISSAKLPAEVPKVNSKWSGLPNPKKSIEPSSTESLKSSASSISSKASRGSKGLQTTEGSINSFNTYSRSIGGVSTTQGPTDNKISRTWVSPPSPTAPSAYSLPTLSSGTQSTVSTPKESPFQTPDEMFPHVLSTTNNLLDPSASTSSARSPKILKAKSFQSFRTQDLDYTSTLREQKDFELFDHTDSDQTLSKSLPLPQTTHGYLELAKNGQDSSVRSASIVQQRPITSHSSVSDNSTRMKQITAQSGALQSPSATEEQPSLSGSPILTNSNMLAKRTTNQQKALEKVAPWEEPGFQLPPLPPADIDGKGKESRVKKFFRT